MPSFFNIDMDDLSAILNETKTGCNVSAVLINHMFYADSVLMAPSPIALQKILDICYEYSCEFQLKYIAKTVCMALKPKWHKYLNNPLLH